MHILLVLGLLIAGSKIIGELCDRIKIPPVIGMIILGLILGPSVTGLITPSPPPTVQEYESLMHTEEGESAHESLIDMLPSHMTWEIVRFFGLIGVIILLFMAGLETDLTQFLRVGTASLWVALGGMIVPMISGAALSLLFYPGNSGRAVLMGVILTATSVSISVISLMERKRLQSPEGMTILSAAIIDDVLGIILLSVVLGLVAGDRNELILTLAWIGGYCILAIPFGLFIVPFIMNLSRRLNTNMGVQAIAIALMFLFAWAAETAYVAGITGAYLAGLFIGRTQLRHGITEAMQTIGNAVFISIFFVYIGLLIDLRRTGLNWLFMLCFISVAIIGKIVGAGVPARFCGFSYNRSFIIGAGMVPRGEVALVIASMGLRHAGLLDANCFAATVVLVLVSSLIAPFLLARGYSSKE